MGHAHFLHDLIDSPYGPAHLCFADCADAANAKGRYSGQIGAIDDVASPPAMARSRRQIRAVRSTNSWSEYRT